MRRRARVSEKIYSYLVSAFGDEAAKSYWEFTRREPSKYIRVNELKISKDNLKKQLQETYGITTEDLGFPTNALKIKSGYEYVGSTLELAFGFYYIQGFSSMLPPIVLNPSPEDEVLDLCSAPGSKTTQLAEMMNNQGLLVVNEVQLDRIKALIFNLDKMNFVNFGVVNSRGEILSKYYDAKFDKILVDAPCSGLGIIQKRKEINRWWSLERVARMSEIQSRLIISAIKMLKTGGEIVYSTCSLTPEENELVVHKLMEDYPIEIMPIELPIEHREGITKYQGQVLSADISQAIRIFPWEADSDGFFMIKLKKTGETAPLEQPRWKRSYTTFMHDPADEKIRDLLKHLSDEFGIKEDLFSEFKFLLKRNDVFFVTKNWDDNNLGLFHRVGTKFGTIDKNKNIVLHSHAAQILQNKITKNIYEIQSLDELRIYLQGGLIVNDELPSGQYAVRFNDYILGTGVVIKGGLKSRFPRSKRTQRIRIKGQLIQ